MLLYLTVKSSNPQLFDKGKWQLPQMSRKVNGLSDLPRYVRTREQV